MVKKDLFRTMMMAGGLCLGMAAPIFAQTGTGTGVPSTAPSGTPGTSGTPTDPSSAGLPQAGAPTQGVPIDHCVSHAYQEMGNTVSCYFLDPEGNRLEIYALVPERDDARINRPLDLDKSVDEIVAQQSAYLHKGGAFIVGIPTPRVIGAAP